MKRVEKQVDGLASELRDPEYISECELAGRIGIAAHTLANWRFLGKGFPYFRIGRTIRYRRKDVSLYIKQRKVNPKRDG